MGVRSTRVKAGLGSVGLLIATAWGAAAVPASAATQGADSPYIVLYRGGASSADAAATVSNAGGTLVAHHPQNGTGRPRSSGPTSAATGPHDGTVAGPARD